MQTSLVSCIKKASLPVKEGFFFMAAVGSLLSGIILFPVRQWRRSDGAACECLPARQHRRLSDTGTGHREACFYPTYIHVYAQILRTTSCSLPVSCMSYPQLYTPVASFQACKAVRRCLQRLVCRAASFVGLPMHGVAPVWRKIVHRSACTLLIHWFFNTFCG